MNEVHGSATKKNKEWQEKLPIVVLKAEEIMYSKANSEVHLTFFFRGKKKKKRTEPYVEVRPNLESVLLLFLLGPRQHIFMC